MVEDIIRVGFFIKRGGDFVFVLAVNDAVVQFAVVEWVEVDFINAFPIIVNRQSHIVVGGKGAVIANGAMHETIVAAMNLDGIHTTVGDDEILQFSRIINAVEPASRLVFDNRIAHAQCALRGFQHRLAVDADETVADDGVVDDVVGTFAAIHEHDLVPLAGLVGIFGFQSVAFDDYWSFFVPSTTSCPSLHEMMPPLP